MNFWSVSAFLLLLFLLNNLNLTQPSVMVHAGCLRCFYVTSCLQSSSHAMSATSSSNLLTPLRATHTYVIIFISKLFLFPSRVNKVLAQVACCSTVVHKVSHSSGLEQKVETSGPALSL